MANKTYEYGPDEIADRLRGLATLTEALAINIGEMGPPTNGSLMDAGSLLREMIEAEAARVAKMGATPDKNQ